MIEHDAKRRQQYWTARAYFSICNSTTGEILSEIAIRKRHVVLGKTQEIATKNLKLLDRFMNEHRDVLGWIPPQGGMTAFPWLVSGENARPFCQAAAERGILLAPGDCFEVPAHFRLGFGAVGENFPKANFSGWQDANRATIFGFHFAADATRQLQSVTLTPITVQDTIVFFGATGVLARQNGIRQSNCGCDSSANDHRRISERHPHSDLRRERNPDRRPRPEEISQRPGRLAQLIQASDRHQHAATRVAA